MLLTPLLTATLEASLNRLLYRDRSMKSARSRLSGKVLKITLKELGTPITLVFGEQQVDVVGQWDGEANCTVMTRLSVLVKLRDRQQLSPLMRSGDLLVEGDIQVIQQLTTLLDIAEWDPAELLAPYVGDIVAHGVSQAFFKGAGFIKSTFTRQQRYLGETLTEEWRVAPGSLEFAYFQDEVDALSQQVDALDARLNKMETK
ncbi:ubiquinone biosynthesis protein UbiJ [Edaphovirga cremea]|uniref:ubiquinone biosynthesis protein UbiJ n=1 Tax=Edaphovirga cremea TaxID=2267246 RepID=UPI0039896E50